MAQGDKPVMDYDRPIVNPYRPFEQFRAGAWCTLIYGVLVALGAALTLYVIATTGGLGRGPRQLGMALAALVLAWGVGIMIAATLASNGKRGGAIASIILVSIHMVLLVLNLFFGGMAPMAIGCGIAIGILGLLAIGHMLQALRGAEPRGR
jgi:hypothetical protein